MFSTDFQATLGVWFLLIFFLGTINAYLFSELKQGACVNISKILKNCWYGFCWHTFELHYPYSLVSKAMIWSQNVFSSNPADTSL